MRALLRVPESVPSGTRIGFKEIMHGDDTSNEAILKQL